MAQSRVYEDFQPRHDWARDERSHTLILPLEGFSRSQLKVQITATRNIRVRGERQVEGNKWRRFYMEFPVPQDSDTNDIGAKFERGTLYVRFPKLITPATMPPQPSPAPTQQAPPPRPPPPKLTTREEPKAEEAIEKKPETKRDETKMEQNEKEPPKDYKKEDISEGKELKEKEAKSKAPETTEDRKKQGEESRRAPFSEGLSSMQGKDYKDVIVRMVEELKKQNVINRLVVVSVVLLLGLYLKHLIVSSFGGSSKSHQEL